jgi:hypothetical protein
MRESKRDAVQRLIVIATCVLLLSLSVSGSVIAVGSTPEQRFTSDQELTESVGVDSTGNMTRYVVNVNQSDSESFVQEVETINTITIESRYGAIDSVVFSVSAPGPAIVQRLPGVSSIGIDREYTLDPQPNGSENDPRVETMTSHQRTTALEQLNVLEHRPHSAEHLDVAVIDTGIDYDHQDLDVTWGFNSVDGTISEGLEASDDVHGHGTNVAGTIAALNNSQDTIGITPNVDLYSARTSEGRSFRTSWSVTAIYEVMKGPDGEVGTEDDADVISMSFGDEDSYGPQREAIREARENGIIVVASAGNTGDDNPNTDEVLFPASYDTVIGVGAVNRQSEVPKFSSEGPDVEVVAPGTQVRTTKIGGGTEWAAGTSMAAPLVSGVAVSLLASGMEQKYVRQALTQTARDIGPEGRDAYSGYGLVDYQAAHEFEPNRPPNISVSSPERPIESGTRVTFSVRITDDKTPNSLLNISIEDESGTNTTISGRNGTKYTFQTLIDSGTEGIRELTVTVTDEQGLQAQLSINLNITTVDKPFKSTPLQTANGEVFPRDIDGDGEFEDINENERVDFNDVVVLFGVSQSTLTDEQRLALDFDNDSHLTYADVVKLFSTMS